MYMYMYTGIIVPYPIVHVLYWTLPTLSIVSTQNGVTPLMTASFHGHVDIVRMLIEAKAQVNTQEEVHVTCTCILLLSPENTLYNTSSYVIDNVYLE